MQKYTPQCFVDKVNFDDGIRELRTYAIVPFSLYRQVKDKQDQARQRCKILMLTSKVDPDGSGRPMAMRG